MDIIQLLIYLYTQYAVDIYSWCCYIH